MSTFGGNEFWLYQIWAYRVCSQGGVVLGAAAESASGKFSEIPEYFFRKFGDDQHGGDLPDVVVQGLRAFLAV